MRVCKIIIFQNIYIYIIIFVNMQMFKNQHLKNSFTMHHGPCSWINKIHILSTEIQPRSQGSFVNTTKKNRNFHYFWGSNETIMQCKPFNSISSATKFTRQKFRDEISV